MCNNLLEFLNHEGIFINAPTYRGAPMPPSNPEAINEGDFEDENRAKQVDFDIDTIENTVNINWMSQEYSDSYSMFKQEIKRYFKYMKSIYGDDSIITVRVKLHDKDCMSSSRFTLKI